MGVTTTVQSLDIHRPEMPDLQFALLITALCTSPLTTLNISDNLRARVFDRCWVLIHDNPPPGRPEERVIDLRSWTEVTLDAMVETIRTVLSEAGIRRLTWDHPPSAPRQNSTPAAQPLIDRLEELYPHLSVARAAVGGEAQDRADNRGDDARQVVDEIAVLMTTLLSALERRAKEIEASRGGSELVDKLLESADVLRGSGTMYLAWARHYAALSEGNPEAAESRD